MIASSAPEEEHKDSSASHSSYYSSMSTSQMSQHGGVSSEPAEQMYQLKTMCLAKKTVQMPTKEEHGFLLFCGLGARRWQIGMDCNSLSFKQAILNIYPRLRSVIGYNLWALTKDRKNFERIPEKVNTPRRMRSYLGSLFTGCLIIVPVSDIMLMEERREHLRIRDMKEFRDLKGPPMQNMEAENRLSRSSCLICGKMEKTAGTGSFHKIHTETMSCPDGGGGEVLIVRKLTDLLGFSFDGTKRRMPVSDEICRRCMKSVKELLQKEEELKVAKADLLATFFSTAAKFGRNQVAVNDAADDNDEAKGGRSSSSAISPLSSAAAAAAHYHRHHHHHHNAPADLSSLHHLGLYGLPNSSSGSNNSQQQQLLLAAAAALPSAADLSGSSLAHHHKSSSNSNGFGPPPAALDNSGLLPYYRSRLGLGDSAASCNNRIILSGGTINGGRSDCYTNGDGAELISRISSDISSAGVPVNYFHHLGSGSEYARSEVGSSSFISVSPPRQEFSAAGGGGSYQQTETENESRLSSSLSPRPFDSMSYASTFSLKSCNSTLWPRNGSGTTSNHHHHHYRRASETTTSHKRRRSASGGDEEEATNGGGEEDEEETNRSGENGAEVGRVKREMDEEEEEDEEDRRRRREQPPTAESPPAGSPSSGSSGGSHGDDKAEEGEEEEAARDRRKPWKKRRRVQESSNKAANATSGHQEKGSSASDGSKNGGGDNRTDESNESSNYEDQLDSSNSTPPQSRTPTA